MTDWRQPQPGPRVLFSFIKANFPIVRNDGIYNPRYVAGTKTLSHHAEGRALDIGSSVMKAEEKLLADRLFSIFVDCASSLGLDEIIWNRQISSSARNITHAYSGHDPHTGHIHVGFTREASQRTMLPPNFVMKIGILRTGLEQTGGRVGAPLVGIG